MTDIVYLRTVSTALALIRDGLNTALKLQQALDLTPVGMADLLEGLERDQYILRINKLLVLTGNGRQIVQHLKLVTFDSNNRVFSRWAASNPDGRTAV